MFSRPDCIFEIHQLWLSDFSWVYSNCCCSCSFEGEIIKIGQSSHKMYSNKILNFQESTIILNACTKSLETYWRHHVHEHHENDLTITSGNLLRMMNLLIQWMTWNYALGHHLLTWLKSFLAIARPKTTRSSWKSCWKVYWTYEY